MVLRGFYLCWFQGTPGLVVEFTLGPRLEGPTVGLEGWPADPLHTDSSPKPLGLAVICPGQD